MTEGVHMFTGRIPERLLREYDASPGVEQKNKVREKLGVLMSNGNRRPFKIISMIIGFSLAAIAAYASEGLSDLDKMTFSCPQAALNAAAREAAEVKAKGTYSFVYYNVVNPSWNAEYDIRFKSNYHGEADLNYTVTVYCQQGWDPNQTVEVKLRDEHHH